MTQIFTTKVRDLVIPIGENVCSPIVQGDFETGDAQSISIITPVNADQGTFYIEIAEKGDAESTDDFFPLEDNNGNFILAPSPGRAKEYQLPSWPSWRIRAAAAVSIETTFKIMKSHY